MTLKPRLAIRGSKGTHARSPFLLVRVHTGDGLTGLGEVSATPRWSGEDAVTAAHFIDTLLAPAIAGRDPRDIEDLSHEMNRALAGNWFTKAAIEMALWDIAGKAAGLPVFRLLGGPVRDAVQTKWSVSGVEPEKAAAIAAWAIEQGFRYLKVKVGIDPDQDVERVRAVRRVAGDAIPIGVDANGAWPAAVAIATIRRLHEFGIAFAEQPVPPGDPGTMAEVRRAAGVPIVADES
ncbi:MAG: mandelate racemase/muconate lactonizing enzyme family protein, partial [Bryobacteraceae bacterium]